MDDELAVEVKRLHESAWLHTATWTRSMAAIEALLRNHLEQHPDCVDAMTSLGAALSDQGKHAEAVGVLSRAKKLGSSDAHTYFNLAAALMNLDADGRRRARAHFARAATLEAKPTTLEAYFDPHGH